MAALRAIVADDDSEMLGLVGDALHHFGAEVVCVTSGGELLDKLAHDDFDVIVTDISMPWMTGLQVMHSARTAGHTVPVVVITGLRDPTLPAQVRSLGARAELLHKPFSVGDLYAAIRRCLDELAHPAPAE